MINVCFITDKNYTIPTIVALESLKTNTEEKLNIYILSDFLTDEQKTAFKDLSSPHANIEVLIVENPYSSINAEHKYVSKTALLKFALPNIFNFLDKVLYIDSDVLILDNITKLYETNVEGKYAAVVADMLWTYKHKHHLNFNLPCYFNSGMMLLNLKKMREDNVSERLLENKLNERFHQFMDQDSLNETFNGKVIWLSVKYNFLLLDFSINEMSNFWEISKSEMKQICNKPAILHYAGCLKPWNTIDAPRFSIWFSYFKSLPESSLKTEKLAEIQFQLKELPKKKIKEFIQQIFSVKNSQNKKHKIVTILGLKVKIKRSK